MLKKNEKTIYVFQILLDQVIVAACWLLAYFIRFNFIEGAEEGLELYFIKITPLLLVITFISFNREKLYNSQRFTKRLNEILAVFKANSISIITFILIIYFLADDRLSRITIGIYFLLSTFSLILFRIIVRNYLRSIRLKGRNLRHVLLIGNGKQIQEYKSTVLKFKDSGIRFLGWIDPPENRGHNIPKVKQDYLTYIKEQKPDSVILGYGADKSHKVEEFLKQNYDDLIQIQILPDLSYSLIGHTVDDFGGIPVLTVNQPSISTYELFVKRTFDFLATLVGIFLISPILVLIALGIKISSPGPILYGQRRISLDGEEFTMWKFRSMKVASNEEDKTEWSSKNNPRKTKFGSFLRKTSLDELPQLFNVLIGNMSLVGPRPERPHFVNQFKKEITGYMLRHKMKAGITGWAQVNGWRGDTSLHKRIECDIYYIKNWSLFFDIKILFLTFWKGFINKNAY